jgi:hypothetical protein
MLQMLSTSTIIASARTTLLLLLLLAPIIVSVSIASRQHGKIPFYGLNVGSRSGGCTYEVTAYKTEQESIKLL